MPENLDRTEQNRTEQNRTEQNRTEQNRTLTDKKQHYKQEIDNIAKESFNEEQKEIARFILDRADEGNIDAVYSFITQRVKLGFVFDTAPETRHDCVALCEYNNSLRFGGIAPTENNHKFIIGENYDALKNLVCTYTRNGEGLIDVIYIDPPYNTEKAKEDGNDYKEEVKAEKFIYRDKFTRTGWLNMMRERLVLARKLLSPKGVIFISIDDREQAYLKVLCDEIFGENNFVSNLVWERKKKGSFLSSQITNIKDYVIVYCRDKNKFSGLIGEINTETETYPCINATNRRSICKVAKGIKSNYKMKDHTVPAGTVISDSTMNIKYITDLVIKDGIVAQDFEVEGNWRYKSDVMYEYSLKQELYITNDLYIRRIVSTPRQKTMKDLLSRVGNNENDTYSTPINLNNLFDSGWGSNEDADDELINLFGTERIFSYPKPVKLIKKLICSTRMKDAVVLDFFAGSGTTGQAVMELNNEENGGNRRCILL